jgi:hypothetical protein
MLQKDVRDELWTEKATARILRHYGGVTDTRRRTVDVVFVTTRGEIHSTIEYIGDLKDFGNFGGELRDECKGNRPILSLLRSRPTSVSIEIFRD